MQTPTTRIKVNKNQYHNLLQLTKAPVTTQKSSTLAQQYYRLAKRGLVNAQEIHGGHVTFTLNVPDGK